MRERGGGRERESHDIGVTGREGVTGGGVSGEGGSERGAERYHDEGTQVPVLSQIPTYPEGGLYG